MKKALSIIILINLLFSGCNCSYQYGVYARNNSDQDIRVVYKSDRDQGSKLEQEVTIPAGEQKRIIYTDDIAVPEGCTGTTADHASYVAEYVYAINVDGQKSKLKWLDPTIHFEIEDIQQGTFTIAFDNEDFPSSTGNTTSELIE